MRELPTELSRVHENKVSRVLLTYSADLAFIVPHVRVRRATHIEQAAQRTLVRVRARARARVRTGLRA